MELIIKNISKEFKDKLAVDNFNVTLNSGIYGLLGPNGSGKTTLMRILADVSNPSKGDILINGQSKNKLGAKYRDLIGYVPQNIGFYKNFTAEKFLYYVSALKGVDKEVEKSKVDELLKFVNLEKDRKRKIGKFSGGMKQRLGIAQALLNDPKILILDEPTAGFIGWDKPLELFKYYRAPPFDMRIIDFYIAGLGISFIGAILFALVTMLISLIVKSNMISLSISLGMYYAPRFMAQIMPIDTVAKYLNEINIEQAMRVEVMFVDTNTFNVFGNPMLYSTVLMSLVIVFIPVTMYLIKYFGKKQAI